MDSIGVGTSSRCYDIYVLEGNIFATQQINVELFAIQRCYALNQSVADEIKPETLYMMIKVDYE